jgi:hypothetical protein
MSLFTFKITLWPTAASICSRTEEQDDGLDAGALLAAAGDGADASVVGDVVHPPRARHNATTPAGLQSAARS